jgi:hypothetical protein
MKRLQTRRLSTGQAGSILNPRGACDTMGLAITGEPRSTRIWALPDEHRWLQDGIQMFDHRSGPARDTWVLLRGDIP